MLTGWLTGSTIPRRASIVAMCTIFLRHWANSTSLWSLRFWFICAIRSLHLSRPRADAPPRL